MIVLVNIFIYVNILVDFVVVLNCIQGLFEFDNDNIEKYLQDIFIKNGVSNLEYEDKIVKRDDFFVGVDIYCFKDFVVLL